MTSLATLLRRTTNLALLLAIAATAYVANSTHEAPEGGYHHMSPVEAIAFREMRGLDTATNVPQWDAELAARFPGFRDVASKGADTIPSRVVVVHQDATASVVSLDRAMRLVTDGSQANDVWTVGYR